MCDVCRWYNKPKAYQWQIWGEGFWGVLKAAHKKARTAQAVLYDAALFI